METVINAVSEAEGAALALPPETFRALQDDLRNEIKARSALLELSKDQRADLYQKLLDLQRRPFVNRALEVVEALDVKWSDLWPGATNLMTRYAQHTGGGPQPGPG